MIIVHNVQSLLKAGPHLFSSFRPVSLLSVALAAALALASCTAAPASTPTQGPVVMEPATATPTAGPTTSPAPAESPTPLPVATATAAATPTPPPSPTSTAEPTPSATPTATITPVPQAPQYYSPVRGAQYVSKADSIIVRYGPMLTTQDVSQLSFTVQGSNSGLHEGSKTLADDQRTVIFQPTVPFTPGEQVNVNVGSLFLASGTWFVPLSYSFTVSFQQSSGTPGSASVPGSAPQSAFPAFLTVPQDIPHYIVSGTLTGPADQSIFVAPFYWTASTVGSYLLILNNQGQLVYYQSMADALAGWDFKVQPNGLMSYYDQKSSTYYLMNSHYQVVDSYQAGNGYSADLHDFQLLPNGDALLMCYDTQAVDMSKYVPGGQTGAEVTGLVIQEIDHSKNVVFEWRSWDHFSFSDSGEDLTAQKIDLVHGNALALANDGDLLLSSRNLSEITKIDLQTGDIIWRLGGRTNQFTINGRTFAYQHDVRQLANGDITVFDNGADANSPVPSAGIEYKIDEATKTATDVWDYVHTPPVFTTYMGNTQRLSDGNTFLTWGAPFSGPGYAYDSMTEVSSDGRVLFDLAFDSPYVSYRAFDLPWHGSPDTAPVLADKVDASGVTLGYSWNGATEVAAYRVFGGASPDSMTLVETRTKADFETQSHLALPSATTYYQVAAMDGSGNEMARSNVIEVGPSAAG